MKKVLCLVLMAAVLLSVTAVPVSVSAEPIARYRWFDRTNYGGAATANPDCSSLGAGITRSYVNGLFGKGNDDESHCVTKAAGTALGNDNYLPRASRTAQINGGFLQYGDKVVASAKIATGDTNGNKRFYMTLFFTGNSTTTYVTPYTYNYSFELRGSALWAFNNNTGITLSRNRWYTVTLVYTAGQEGTVQNTCDVYVDGKFITTKNFGVSAANGSNDFNTSLAAMTGVGEVRAEISNSAAASAADIYIDDFTVDVYMGQDAASFNVANALPASMANAVISNNPYISISDEIETGANRLNSRTIDVYKENLGGSNFTKSAFLSGVNVTGTPRIYAADDAKLQTPLSDTTEIVNGMVMAVESADKKMIKYYNINADDNFKDEIRDLANTSTSVSELEGRISGKKSLINLPDEYFNDNAYQTLYEQKDYATYYDVVDMISSANIILDSINKANMSTLLDIIEEHSDIILYPSSEYNYYFEMHPLDKEEILKIILKYQDFSRFSSFTQFRTVFTEAKDTFDLNTERKAELLDSASGAKSASEIANSISSVKDLFDLGNEYFNDNAYQTLYEHRPYESFVYIKEMVIKAKTVLDTLNNTDWSMLHVYIEEEKDVILYALSKSDDYAYYFALGINERNKINKNIVQQGSFSSFTQFRTVFSTAVKNHKSNSSSSTTVNRPPTSGGGGGGSSYVVPSADVVLSMEPTSPPAVVFKDLGSVEWATESITYLYERGIISGGNSMFRPLDNITRAEFVKLLVEAFGISCGNEQSNAFNDVEQDAWYSGYLSAAKDVGIVYGNADGGFGPGQSITRQDMAVMAYRAMVYLNKIPDSFVEKIAFADDEDISDYAKEAVYVMQQAGILSGVGNGFFEPVKHANRAEGAKMIYNIISAY